MTKLEEAYSWELERRLKRGEILVWRYEAITFKLAPDTRYTPDFFVVCADGMVEFHEVKGFRREDSWVKLKVAAEVFPWFRFLLVTNGKGWVIREVA